MKTVKFLTLGLLAGTLALTSCNSDDDRDVDDLPQHIEDHENIEQIVVKVTPKAGGESHNYTYTEGDKRGDTITLDQGVEYVFEVSELNSEDHGKYENIIDEVLEEKEEHFFVYQTDLTDYTFVRADTPESTRANGVKIGLKVDLTVNEAQTGKELSFELKHQPTQVDANANNGLGSSEGGATDLAVRYPVVVVAK